MTLKLLQKLKYKIASELFVLDLVRKFDSILCCGFLNANKFTRK